MLDHFRVLQPIGFGGIAEVYLADDTRLGRRVALKVIQPRHLGSKEAVNRFFLEAKATAKLNHPCIVTIYFIGTYQGCPYLALEYVEGRTLRRVLRDGMLEIAQLLELGAAIAEALAEAHRNQVLHRDLKPENVIIAADGRPRVLDFGLAKIQQNPEEVLRVTATVWRERPELGSRPVQPPRSTEVMDVYTRGFLVGSPPYMAPEQWMGEECSPETDVWALGVLLYEMATGKRPFTQAQLSELCHQVLTEEVRPPLGAGLPADLGKLISACLAKDPRARPKSSDVARTLRSLLDRVQGHGTRRVQLSAAEQAVQQGRERLALAILGTVLAVVLGLAVAIYIIAGGD